MPRDRVKEENDYNELTNVKVNSTEQVNLIKYEIAKLVPNDLKIIAKNESQKKLINSIKNKEITICSGRAGTGKTFVALAYALSLLRKNTNRYKRLYLVKSVRTLKDEELGFLKGGVKEKFDPYMWSFYINMEKIIPEANIEILLEKEILRPFPLAFIKGTTLDDCIIIADEMQNISLDNALTLLTRIGSNSKLILLGDIDQIDLRNKSESSLQPLLKMYKNVDDIGVIEMDNTDDSVRNPIINIIIEKYKEYIALTGETKTNKLNKDNKQLLVENEKKD
jgi:phosphate starvation-inducible PhoH-like protein